MKKSKKIVFITILTIIVFIPLIVYAGRGCCSYHGGQDYCDTSTGIWVCNDGTYSSTCICKYDDSTSKNNNYISNTNNENIIYQENNNSNVDNTLSSIIIAIISWIVFSKIINDNIVVNNEILKKTLSVLTTIISITMLWIIGPFTLGLKGYFLLEIISILFIVILNKIEE